MSKKRLIVDGYNVIRMTPPYREIAEHDLDAARAALVSDVAAYVQGEWDATIVFDGGRNPHSTGTPHHAIGVEIIFSAFGAEADTVIERLSRSARERGEFVEVVTSDAQTQWAVLGSGVARRSSGEFAADLRTGEAEWREHRQSGTRSSRLEDRIDQSVRTVLERWSRGMD